MSSNKESNSNKDTNSRTIKKSKINTVKSTNVISSFSNCRFCEWQFISKSGNQKFTTKMYCHHLERTHKLSKKEISDIMKTKTVEAHNLKYGSNTNIRFTIDNGNRTR